MSNRRADGAAGGPDAWAVDDLSFPKDGRMSVAVAPQYCGARWASRRTARSR
ncbi:transposase [Streptomyces sp. NPDC051133]|uniref:transposase n=1 Tax=Streptomyces sp. NPDC051133 TaxID=3155521 RepID=UPI00343D3BBE